MFKCKHSVGLLIGSDQRAIHLSNKSGQEEEFVCMRESVGRGCSIS